MTADGDPCNESLKDPESRVRAQEEGWDFHSVWLLGMLSYWLLKVCGWPSFHEIDAIFEGLRTVERRFLGQIGLNGSLCGFLCPLRIKMRQKHTSAKFRD